MIYLKSFVHLDLGCIGYTYCVGIHFIRDLEHAPSTPHTVDQGLSRARRLITTRLRLLTCHHKPRTPSIISPSFYPNHYEPLHRARGYRAQNQLNFYFQTSKLLFECDQWYRSINDPRFNYCLIWLWSDTSKGPAFPHYIDSIRSSAKSTPQKCSTKARFYGIGL